MAVYFARRDNGAIKIGKSRNVPRRLKRLEFEIKESMTLLGAMPGYTEEESALHIRFSGSNIEGEWFRETRELLQFISGSCCPLEDIKEPEREKVQVKIKLFEFWRKREIKLGRTISIREVSKATGVSPSSIQGLLDGSTTRFDINVFKSICKFFNIPPGPVPFIVYEPDSE